MTCSQLGKIVPPTIHHLPLYPSAGLWRGWSLSRLPPGVESCQFACPPTHPGSFSPVSICCRLLRLRLSSFRSLHVRNCWGFRCLMLFPDRSILTMSIGSPDGTWFKSTKKNRRDVKTQDPVSAKIVHGAEMMTQQKNKNKKWPPRASGETRDSVCGLRGFQDVLWVVATVNVFKLERRVTTWTRILPPDGSHGLFLPRLAFEALMYKPVSSTYSPTDDGRSRDFRLQPVT